jgi:tRNA(Ile)-lysidine synthase TilS/MesJ
MKYYIPTIILLALLLSNAYAENETQTNTDKYKQNYATQLIPLLKERMGTELEMQSDADAHEHVSKLATRMATCQLVAIESYPQKYQDASINPVANGVDLKKANEDLNQIIQTDIQNGDITDQALKTMTEAAIEKYKICLSDSEPNPSNLPQ